MTSLFLAGLILEPYIGTGRFLLAYLVSGVVAGLASIGWYDDLPSVGASGAIFGLYGLALALIQNKIFPSDWKYVFLIAAASMAGYGFLIGLFGGIDNAAHLGGIITGYLFGLMYTPAIRKRVQAREQALSSAESYRD
jgi:membrane associated rhomboid family serine protease